MCDDVDMEWSSIIDYVPSEILVNIFSYLPPIDLFFNVAHVCHRWRNVIHSNLKMLPLIPCHCHVQVMDMEVTSSSQLKEDGTNPMMQYSFSLFDTSASDFKSKLKQCRRGNSSCRELWVSHRVGQLDCEWEHPRNGSGDVTRPERAEPEVVQAVLKYLRVEAVRFEVRKQGRKLVCRMKDDRFAHGMKFLETVCSEVSPKALYLSSRSPHFPWSLADESQKRLCSLRHIRYLTLENMTSLDCLGQGDVLGGLRLQQMKYVHLRMDATHRQELENTLWTELDGSILFELLRSHQRNLEFIAYNDVPQVITAITAADMCKFIVGWRLLSSPWIIHNIAFNSIVTISELRTVATRMELFQQHHLEDVPYCRFRTFHPSDPNLLLELACYGNGTATLWSIRSGYPRR